jgi:hypothetical protein
MPSSARAGGADIDGARMTRTEEYALSVYVRLAA